MRKVSQPGYGIPLALVPWLSQPKRRHWSQQQWWTVFLPAENLHPQMQREQMKKTLGSWLSRCTGLALFPLSGMRVEPNIVSVSCCFCYDGPGYQVWTRQSSMDISNSNSDPDECCIVLQIIIIIIKWWSFEPDIFLFIFTRTRKIL